MGIVTRTPSSASGRPGLIVLNAGVIHRVGPHRMNVALARRSADAGFPAMRYDLGGLGDSRAQQRHGADPTFRERAVADTRAAMDCLERAEGVREFVLFGLCSGADNGLATALADRRVVGLVLVDPYTWVTPQARVRKLRSKVEGRSPREIAAWGVSTGLRKARGLLSELKGRASAEAPAQQGRTSPAPEEFGGWLHQLLDRRVSILAVYSGSLGERYNDEDQLFETFPDLRGRVDHAWFPEANHTFTSRQAQRRLIDTTTAWLTRRFAG